MPPPMKLDRSIVFGAFRTILLARTGVTFTAGEIAAIDAAFDETERKAGIVIVAAPTVVETPKFVLSTASVDKLKPVKVELANCVRRAIQLTSVDFRVQQGLRTEAEQRAAVASGNSRTMKSKHLKQPDGTVWAVDLAVLEDTDHDGDTEVSWRFEAYANIAFAMDQAATELGVSNHIRWGCAWDRVLCDFGGSPQAYLQEAAAYAKRHPGKDLLDGPHFEWVP